MDFFSKLTGDSQLNVANCYYNTFVDRSDAEQGERIPFWSESLWKQIAGKVDFSFRGRLEWLDIQQHKERISPQLAESIRIVIHQAVAEEESLKASGYISNNKGINSILIRSLGVPGLKFIMSELEGTNAYRIRKAADKVEKQTGLPAFLIIREYVSWIHEDEENEI